jgi:hypothetical protein
LFSGASRERGLSSVRLRASGKRKAPRKTRMMPAATSQRAAVRWPRMPIAKPIRTSAM